jgi:hypothetical protein
VFTLVPSHFFDPATAREALSEVAQIKDGDAVEYIEIPQYDAVLVYAKDGDSAVSDRPEIYRILTRLPACPEYNKILCSQQDGRLYLAVAQGKNLLLANSFPARDFTTAEYYLFLALNSLQLNPEISTVCFLTPLDAEDEMSLYRYFKAVERL